MATVYDIQQERQIAIEQEKARLAQEKVIQSPYDLPIAVGALTLVGMIIFGRFLKKKKKKR